MRNRRSKGFVLLLVAVVLALFSVVAAVFSVNTAKLLEQTTHQQNQCRAKNLVASAYAWAQSHINDIVQKNINDTINLSFLCEQNSADSCDIKILDRKNGSLSIEIAALAYHHNYSGRFSLLVQLPTDSK